MPDSSSGQQNAGSQEKKSRPRHRTERQNLAAGIAVGSIIGMPLLYTMEMWSHGITLAPWHLLVVLAATLIINWLFCAVSGFRPEHRRGETTMQAVTSVGLAIVYSAVILWLIGSVTWEDVRTGAWGGIAGKMTLEAVAVSLGISFANIHQGGGSRTSGGHDPSSPPPRDAQRKQLHQDLGDLAAATAGSALFALNIAPTEEVIFIFSRLGPWHLLAMLGASVMLCHIILYGSGFERQPVYVPNMFQHPWAETILTTAVSLVVSAGLLWMLGEHQTTRALPSLIAATVVLGLPATVGGAAGRLAI